MRLALLTGVILGGITGWVAHSQFFGVVPLLVLGAAALNAAIVTVMAPRLEVPVSIVPVIASTITLAALGVRPNLDSGSDELIFWLYVFVGFWQILPAVIVSLVILAIKRWLN